MNRKNRMKVALRHGMARAFVLAPVVFLLVAGAGCPSLFESTTQRATRIKQAEVGKDGTLTLPPATPTVNTVVNVYAQLALDAAKTNTTITVNDVNHDFLGVVAKGDLLLIVQMAGATINTSDAPAYGTVMDLGGAGNYEFIGVEGVATGGGITLACGLKNAYTRAGKTQVIRVPQYTTVIIGTGNAITARAWDGVTGGVVAFHAETTLQLDGSIDVSAAGFRGGEARTAKTSAAAGSGIAIYRSAVETDGAEKGEGIAGYQGDYEPTTNPNNIGRYGRGAPANGGGGGDSHNAGGGGGANAGNPAGWIGGLGVMRVDPTVVGGTLAWPLEVATLATSEGGGRGGYSYSANGGGALDPTTDTGRPTLTTWGGDNRRIVGGLGGHPVPNNPAATLFLGGGGGAGDGNNGVAGPGGRGGGLIFIIAGTVAGSGALHADGEKGGSSTGTTGTAGDAAGGGGGGGTVVVISGSLPTAIAITANGGVGGDHTNSINANEVEGPGGGGGGGYIAVSGGTPSVDGALGGTTTVQPSAMASFRANGATAGHAGLTNGSATTFLYCGALPVTTITAKPASHTNVTTGSFTFTNTVNPVTYACKLDTPAGAGTWVACDTGDPSNPAYTTGPLTDGTYTLSVRATDTTYANVENPPVTYTWNVDTVPPVTTIADHPTDPSYSSTGSFTFTNSESPAPVTYACKLDTPAGAGAWAACDTGNPSNPAYTADTPTDGTYKLWVRSTDQAGNVEVEPPYVTWTWRVELSLDGGSLDGGAVDSGGEVAAVVLVDAEGVDAFVNEDLAVAADAGPPDIAPDTAPIVSQDTAPLVTVDAGVDGEGVDVLLFLDVGEPRDTKALDAETAGTGVLADALPSGPEPGPDTAPPAPEPNPDTAAPVVKEDAAAPIANKDAAPAAEDLKIMGAGFCAIASPHSTSPAPFLVLGLAGLALLRRRRKS